MKLDAEIKCPNCGRKFTQRVEAMRPGSSRSCPHCRVPIDFKGDDGRKVQRAMDDLERSLKKMGFKIK